MPSISKTHMRDSKLVKRVALYYKQNLVTVGQAAKKFGVNHLTARVMIREHLTDAQFNVLKRTRYRESKLGEKNPQYGKRYPLTDCEDGYGYLTRLVDGKRYFVHRIIFAEALGIHVSQLPEVFTVHHIDENPKNNLLDNLCLTTTIGHSVIHTRYRLPAEDLLLKKLSVRECIQYMTSK